MNGGASVRRANSRENSFPVPVGTGKEQGRAEPEQGCGEAGARGPPEASPKPVRAARGDKNHLQHGFWYSEVTRRMIRRSCTACCDQVEPPPSEAGPPGPSRLEIILL